MWKIIDYSGKLFSEMIDMTREYYGEDNDISHDAFIQSEYFENPIAAARIKFAYDQDKKRLAGQYIVLPKLFSVNKKYYETVLSLNTLTRSDYRGQHIFSKLAEANYLQCQRDQIKFCYGAPNPNSVYGFLHNLKFKKMGEIPLSLKINNPFYLTLDKLHINYKCDNQPAKKKMQQDSQIVLIEENNVTLFDQLWDELNGKYPVMGVRDAAYVKWRYINLPRRDYIIYVALENNKPAGYIIGRIMNVAGMRCGMIVDFLFSKGRIDMGEKLLNYLQSDFNNSKVGLYGSLMMKKTEEKRVLEKNGFFECPKRLLPQPFPIIFRQFNELDKSDNETVLDFDNWFFTMGDYDVI